MSQHLSDDQLVDQLYGIADSSAHLDACAECRARCKKVQQIRLEATSSDVLPVEYFHQQRRRIQERLGTPVGTFRAVWVPATFAALLIAGFVVTRSAAPSYTPVPQLKWEELIEAGWFEDTYSATRVLEPRAGSPIRELFTEGPVAE